MNNKVFYPKNRGGMFIKWVDERGNKSKTKDQNNFTIDHVATMRDEYKNNEMNTKRVFLDFFTEADPESPQIEDTYSVFLCIDLTSAIKNDIEWIKMHNNSLNNNIENSHYINVDSLSITSVEVNEDFKFIRIHYDFCQPHYGCSDSRRMMVGGVHRLMDYSPSTTNCKLLITNQSDSPIVFW